MATKAAGGTRARKTAAKPAAKKAAPRKIEPATSATFGIDDKRAQYARLVVFNFAVKSKMANKDQDVNSVPNSVLEKAGKELANGNLLHGQDGLTLITDLSKKGATDEKVADRGLTKAYAAEVRPFIRRLHLADSFGRRSKPRAEKAETKAPAKKTAKAAPAEPAGNDGDA
jgi:hypothetical protein